MSESIQNGLLLLVIGMLTVFAVLTIVVLTGKVLIYSLSRTPRLPETQSPRVRTGATVTSLTPQKLAAITIATQLLTEESLRIAHIERIES